MSYTKQTWQTGEVITQEKLNHMEDGIGSCVMVVNELAGEDSLARKLDKTWQEITDALSVGKIVVVKRLAAVAGTVSILIIGATTVDSNEYSVFGIGSPGADYTAAGADQYPESAGL